MRRFLCAFIILTFFLSSCSSTNFSNNVSREPAASIQTCWKAIMAFLNKKRGLEKKSLEFKIYTYVKENSLGLDEIHPLPKELVKDVKKLKFNDDDEYVSKYFRLILDKETKSYKFQFNQVSPFNGGKGLTKSFLAKSDIWSKQEKILTGINDEYFTFSTDSELPLEDAYRAISLDIVSSIKLDKLLERFKLTKKEASEKLNISPKQIDAFALRKNVPKDKEFYVPSDFSPSYFQTLMLGREKMISQNFTQDVATNLQNRNLPLNAHIDLDYIEMTHKSWEESPASFASLMDQIHQTFSFPMSHLHVGVPISLVNEEKLVQISQLAEAILVLVRAEDFGAEAKPLKYFGTNFKLNKLSERGMIKVGKAEWSKPFPSHNIEVRQYPKYPSISYGLKIIEFIVKLSKDVEKINYPESFQAHYILDNKTQSLNQSLRLIGTILKDSPHSEIGDELIKFSNKIQRDGSISDEVREEVQAYMKEVRLSHLLEDYSLFITE